MASALQLKRFVVRGYKSIADVQVELSGNLTVFVGRNDVGKSNLIDFFAFVRDSRNGFQHALAGRGESLREVLHRKAHAGVLETELDFSVPSDERLHLITELFQGNPSTSPEQILASDFLEQISVKFRLEKDTIFEEVTCSNIRAKDTPCVVFRTTANSGRFAHLYGGLEAACKRDSKTVITDAKETASGSGHQARLSLGCLSSYNQAWTSSLRIASLLNGRFETFLVTSPFRIAQPKMPIQGASILEPDASNLADVMHSLYNNKPARFARIQEEVNKLIPHLGRMYTPTNRARRH